MRITNLTHPDNMKTEKRNHANKTTKFTQKDEGKRGENSPAPLAADIIGIPSSAAYQTHEIQVPDCFSEAASSKKRTEISKREEARGRLTQQTIITIEFFYA